MKKLLFAAALIFFTSPAYAAVTSLQWGVDRTTSPWTTCVYDANNICQGVFTVPATGGGALAPPARGGTGVNNGASTFTIGGNTAFSGAFTFTGTLTGNTAVIFPTSGTLATTTTPAASIVVGSTAITGGTPNGLLWNSAGNLGNLSTVNSGVLVTSSGGAPSISTMLPGGLSIPNVLSQTTSDPLTFSFTPPGFGGTWLTQSEFTSSYALTHADGRSTLNISRLTTGSGTNGPSSADYGSFTSCQKLNYLTSAVEGECDGAYFITAQGNKGDTSAILTGASKVRGGSGPTGGASGTENSAQWLDSSGNTLMNVHNLTAFAEGAGGQSTNTGFGQYVESLGATQAVAANIVQPWAAYYGGVDDSTYSDCSVAHCPTFTNLLVGAGSRAAADVFFKVSQGLNQAGVITLGSGNALGKDGNGTLSGGTRLSLENNGGTFIVLDANGNNIAQFTQSAILAIGATAHTTGEIELVGSTSGASIIAAQASAGTPSDLIGTTSGTLVASATAPLVDNAVTGVISCPTCATTTSGGTLSGTAPVAISAGGVISISGATGQVLAGSAPAFTATPTLGASGTSGTLAFGNATSGTVTLQTVTGALGGAVLSLPAATDQLVARATTDTLTNKTIAGGSNTLSAIANGSLTNSTITLGSTSMALGSTNTTIAGSITWTGSPLIKLNFPTSTFWDTNAACATGAAQRYIGDGAGDFLWQISTDGSCAFGTSLSVFEVHSNGVFESLTSFKASANATVIGSIVDQGNIIATGSVPIGTTGSCVASSFSGGATAGKFAAAVCAAGTIILSSMPAATTGYSCVAIDQTTPADGVTQTASTTTSVTFKATTVAADSIAYHCIGW